MLKGRSLRGRFARGVFWSLAGAVVSRAIALASSVIVARLLGREHFGELGVIQSTVGMFGVFAGFGLSLTATKHVAEFRANDPSRAGRIVILSEVMTFFTGTIMAIGLVMVSPWLAARTLAAPHLTPLLRQSSLLLLLSAICGAQMGALAGFEAFRATARVNVLTGIISFPLMVGGAWLTGLQGAVSGLVAGTGINCLLNHIELRNVAKAAGVPLHIKGCLAERGILWRFSLPAVLGGAVAGPVAWICNAILVNRPHGYLDMGVFNAANQWRSAILFLPSTLGAVGLPLLANMRGENDRGKFRKVFRTNVFLNGGSAFLAVLAITISSGLIMSAYGKDFEGGRGILVVLSFSAVLVSVNNVVGHAIASEGKMWHGLGFNILWGAAMLISALTLIPSHGALGLAWAFLISYALHTLWQFFYVSRFLER